MPPERSAPVGACRRMRWACRTVVAVQATGAVDAMQFFGQASQFEVLPSSQLSPASWTPLPQRGPVGVLVAAGVGVRVAVVVGAAVAVRTGVAVASCVVVAVGTGVVVRTGVAVRTGVVVTMAVAVIVGTGVAVRVGDAWT